MRVKHTWICSLTWLSAQPHKQPACCTRMGTRSQELRACIAQETPVFSKHSLQDNLTERSIPKIDVCSPQKVD